MSSQNIKLEELIKFADAIFNFLYPLCDIKIYDIKNEGKIIYSTKGNKFQDTNNKDENILYEESQIKELSVIINNIQNTPSVKIVFKLNVSLFQMVKNASNMLEKFLISNEYYNESISQEKISIDKIREFIDDYCFKNVKNPLLLSKKDKEKIVYELNNSGYFELKTSIQVTSKILGVSRGTIYNYIQKISS